MTDQISDQRDPDPQRTETVLSEAAPIPTRIPERIGRYHIKRVIASGGMGTVYEATQDNPRRVVAVKVMKQGITSKSALHRFEYEGQILGRLRHPGIAQIYEAGTYDPDQSRADQDIRSPHAEQPDERVTGLAPGALTASVPYFAMEYIPNAKTITTYADEKKLGTRQRMELFAKVCDAIHHGHQKGIIHRDLKPSNILVDSTGQVKIIDFGVARSTDSDMAVTTLQTDVGQLIGTLQYMSPEQCEGDPHDIDTRSDVYALGMVFYQLLCGKLPYDVTRMAMHQATRAIREQHPTKLSTLDKALRGDVETIALRALEKERERRYQSAAEFGLDIERYLRHEPILARRPGTFYQIRLYARRNKVLVAWVTGIAATLIVSVVLGIALYRNAGRTKTRVRAASIQQLQAEVGGLELEKRWEAAEQRYETLVALDPARVSYFGDIARMKKERYNEQLSKGLAPDSSLLEQAVVLCERALSAAPNDQGLWNTKGVLLKKLNRYNEAIDAYRRALALVPEYSAAWENLGVVYALAGDFPNARRHLREAAELAGTHEQQCEFPWRNLATLELYLGSAQAAESIEKALACKRTDPVTLRVRARMFLELPGASNVKKALEDAANADFLTNGKDPIVKRIRALAYLANDEADDAARCAQAAVELGDDLVTADHLILAIVHAGRKQSAAARESLERAMTLWPTNLVDHSASRATAEGGVLWFEKADTLRHLKEQAEAAIHTAP